MSTETRLKQFKEYALVLGGVLLIALLLFCSVLASSYVYIDSFRQKIEDRFMLQLTNCYIQNYIIFFPGPGQLCGSDPINLTHHACPVAAAAACVQERLCDDMNEALSLIQEISPELMLEIATVESWPKKMGIVEGGIS